MQFAEVVMAWLGLKRGTTELTQLGSGALCAAVTHRP